MLWHTLVTAVAKISPAREVAGMNSKRPQVARAMMVLALAACLAPGSIASEADHGELRKGTFETPFGTVELEYEVIDGRAVYQGDIILPPEVLQSNGKGSKSAGVVSSLGRRWPHGIVYIENSGLTRDSRVMSAIKAWTEKTPLRFVMGVTTGNRLRFVCPFSPFHS